MNPLCRALFGPIFVEMVDVTFSKFVWMSPFRSLSPFRSSGWVYYSPERERVFFIGSKNFNDLNLNRFSKRQNK